MPDFVSLSLTEVEQLAVKALVANDFTSAQAKAIAASVVAAERDECHSHGLFRIPFYLKAGTNTTANPAAEPRLTINETSIVHVDACSGFCPLALQIGLPELAKKTASVGIAALAIHNAYNIAALWPEVESLAEQGFVAFAFTAANAYVAPHGGSKPLFGTNPMAFAWPRAGRPPFVFDQASSASARGEIQLHALAGNDIPDGWAIDAAGNPTNDPESALGGAQLPFGGHKGSSLALMIELLAGALLGDLFSYESSEKDVNKVGAPFGGEFIIAIDMNHTLQAGNAEQAQSRADTLFKRILEQEGTRLPSSRRYEARGRTRDSGVQVPNSVHEQILGFC